MTAAVERYLVDCDGLLGDFPSCALRWVNGHTPLREVTLDAITEHDILKALGLEAHQERFDRWCADTELCRYMPVYDGAQVFVEQLRSRGEVVIVTSPYEAVPTWCHQRLGWLKEHFAINKRDVIFAKRKELVRGHALIDDKTSNCEAFVQGSSFRTAILFDQPWNRGWARTATSGAMTRACGYDAVIKLLEGGL